MQQCSNPIKPFLNRFQKNLKKDMAGGNKKSLFWLPEGHLYKF